MGEAMPSPICVWLAFWRTCTRLRWWSGHDYVTSKEPTPKNVHVLECRRCGHTSVSWSWDSLEDQK